MPTRGSSEQSTDIETHAIAIGTTEYATFQTTVFSSIEFTKFGSQCAADDEFTDIHANWEPIEVFESEA